MGQASVSKPSNPQQGEVDMAMEASHFFHNSREEYSTKPTIMLPSQPPFPNKTSDNTSVRRKRSVHKRRSSVSEDREEEEEEEDESFFASPLSLSLHSPKKFDTEYQQLADVLYSAFHLHTTRDPLLQRVAERGAGTGGAGSGGLAGDEAPSMEELSKELMDVFEVDETTMGAIREEVRTREPPRVAVQVNIHEAKELKPRTPKETSHTYCLVRVSGSSETFKTRVLPDTLSPKWESQFSMWIPARQDAKLTLEVWHDPQEAGVENLMNVKGIREFGRLVRDAATNLQPNEMRNLLGSVTVPLADIKDQSIDAWYNLVKGREEEFNKVSPRESFRASKKRGSVRLTLKVSTISQLNLIGPHWFDGFLSRVIQHHLGYLSSFENFHRGRSRRSERAVFNLIVSPRSTKNNGAVISKSCKGEIDRNSSINSGSSFHNEGLLRFSPPWNGTLSNTKLCLLEHYATTLNLTPPVTAFSWWKVCSRVCVIERAFLGTRLIALQGYLREGRYSCIEREEIKSSLKLWIQAEIDALKNLTTFFPASSKAVSYAQLEGIVRNFNAVENDEITRQLNVFPNESPVSQLIYDSLMEFSKVWWESCLKTKGRNSHNANGDQQLVFAVSVAGEVYAFLADVCNFYHGVFYREANISFLKLTYILLTTELSARVRPLLNHIYRSSTKKKFSDDLRCREPDRYSLESGTPVWQLYKKCEIIENEIGRNLPEEVQKKSGLQSYHHWFLGGIERWMERIFVRTKAVMAEDIERDDMKTNSLGVSTSAVEAKSNFKILKTSWQKLSWPEDVEVDKVVKPLLHNLCGLGPYFARLVIEKLASNLEGEAARDLTFLSEQSCIGLNNIQYLRKEIEAVPEFFELSNTDEGSEPVVTKTSSEMEGITMLSTSRVCSGCCRPAGTSSCLQIALDWTPSSNIQTPFFMKSGKLVIEIIMVKNNISSSRKPPNTQVAVTLVPNDLFRGVLNAKTKVQRKTATPQFEEIFEVTINPTDPGVRAGFLQFLLRSHYLLQSEVIGEALLPLENIPSVDTPKASDIKNKCLKMNMPKSKVDYEAANALKYRTWDRRAQLFLQRMSLRN
ncbi:BAI1-associated protein 3-like isoform X3 [Eriocheir sinensis]|uniref:BAI1-associated protein 3-like isoform X3 n=1 Tax=Eriocheir sinensis TaxID=95602 RepID=UPI0021C5B075|nr:BAI1-associated protein 3-like isoform X3 [Eriocheir sinensis]